jgi:hypothetical protein
MCDACATQMCVTMPYSWNFERFWIQHRQLPLLPMSGIEDNFAGGH